ncbi:hypothetical protein FRC20_007711 [Serendipita sp. 405]|nr:hypothetical protein FRC20_007711 [Serendipita sp. 405]
MGAYTSSAFSSVTRTVATKDARIAMIGLGSAGQTTMYEPILELIVNTTESHSRVQSRDHPIQGNIVYHMRYSWTSPLPNAKTVFSEHGCSHFSRRFSRWTAI